jgi:RNA recognition motif-containing protein
VDQSSISFYVTNFPEDCSIEDLWKVFSRFGRLGDVYIPKKVDKWGKKFAFVKYREDMDAMELSNSLGDVWLGSFKLRLNKSRFARNEDERKKEEVDRKKVVDSSVVNQHLDCSFREALLNTNRSAEKCDKGVAEQRLALEVEVDRVC